MQLLAEFMRRQDAYNYLLSTMSQSPTSIPFILLTTFFDSDTAQAFDKCASTLTLSQSLLHCHTLHLSHSRFLHACLKLSTEAASLPLTLQQAPRCQGIGMYLFTYLEESRRRVLLRARGAGRLFSTFVDLCSSKI